MLHERHALSDAHAGVARLRFEARHQPGAGRYLLRSHLESHSIVRRELDVRPVARDATPGRRCLAVPVAVPALQEWRALVPLPASPVPRHLLLSVLLV